MTTYEKIKGYLEKSTKARERSNKNRFIAYLLDKKYNVGMGISTTTLESLIVDASSYDRAWRQVLQHEAHLRGKDYYDKVMLEQDKELELGYMPGHESDIKKLKTL